MMGNATLLTHHRNWENWDWKNSLGGPRSRPFSRSSLEIEAVFSVVLIFNVMKLLALDIGRVTRVDGEMGWEGVVIAKSNADWHWS